MVPSNTRVRRPGFTIIEIVVALLVAAVGVLALAATTTSVQRLASDASLRTLAANAAQSRFELLRNLECSQIANGSHRTSALIEQWRVSPVAPGMWMVLDSVYLLGQPRAPQIYRSLVAC